MNERDPKKDFEICEKATPGPWEAVEVAGYIRVETDDEEMDTICVTGKEFDSMDNVNEEAYRNAEFIAMAREALPYYIEELTKARERIKALEEALDTSAEVAAIKSTYEQYLQSKNASEATNNRAKLFTIIASSTAGQDLLNRLSRAEQREKQLREALQQVDELLEGIWIPDSDDWKQYVEASKLIRSVLEGAE